MTKEEALKILEGVNGKEIKLGLEKVSALVSLLGHPDYKLKIIHVAGTNGKGSVCEMMSQMLQSCGYKVGTFNSPYFEVPNECIRINGIQISDEDLLCYMEQLNPILMQLKEEQLMPSGFEILTGLALLYFSEAKVDFVILEVGLGGSLDATNVISKSSLSVITKIALDHTDFLGNSLAEIAAVKAGVIKEGGLVVTPKQSEEVMNVFRKQCEKQGAKLIVMEPEAITNVHINEEKTHFQYQDETYDLNIVGTYQAYNGSLAIEAIHTLREEGLVECTTQQIKEGLCKVQWAGRFEKVRNYPLSFIDGAHNVDGIQALVETLEKLPKRHTIAIIGILGDKDVDQMIKILAPHVDCFIVTKPLNPRAMSVEMLASKLRAYTPHVYEKEDIKEAWALALKMGHLVQNGQIIGCGSLYMLAGLRPLMIQEEA